MKTPIIDFVKAYEQSRTVRLHMPGHKGKGFLGVEGLDITEVEGADVLSEARGIIYESERNAASLFKTAHTFYSTEGSSLAIKTMLALVSRKNKQSRCTILAARNVHKSFIHACALLDIDAEWIFSNSSEHLCSCDITPEILKNRIDELSVKPDAVYITSPDYLGNMQDIKGLASVCDEYEIPLLVDNAHGAYLSFLKEDKHPISLGASMCCDSAHKTLPVLTGGAYLHISKKFGVDEQVCRNTMSLFGSTSPSYLVLQSLDYCNKYIFDGYKQKLENTCEALAKAKETLMNNGYSFVGAEPLKFTIDVASYGYFGHELSNILRANGFEAEFADDSFVVLMFTPEIENPQIDGLTEVLLRVEKKVSKHKNIESPSPLIKRAISIREAFLSDSELVDIKQASGRICASPTVSCPPAVPIVMSGEIITDEAVKVFEGYGIKNIEVVKTDKM